jgi:REP element-mobilizing transposase RayT
MSEKYKNKYRISSARLQGYDYGSAGMYFITICTKNRIHYFGEIENGEMILSELGSIITAEWKKTAVIRQDMNVELGAFVVMPNHFHAVLIIGDNQYNTHDSVATQFASKFEPQSKNVASILRGFKSSVTTYARKNNISFDWQPRYHDHIIRTHADYKRISQYILNNPMNWENDTFK